ncbi:hypothetical protein JCM16814_08300 [Desulfobaculum senezii]
MPYLHLTDIQSPHVLLEAIRDFLTANGWSLDKWAHDASSYATYSGSASNEGYRLHVHNGDVYLHLRSATRASVYSTGSWSNGTIDGYTQYRRQLTGLALYPSDGFNAELPWDTQGNYPRNYYTDEGTSVGSAIRIEPGVTPACHVFLCNNPVSLCISVEWSIGKWRHLVAGDVHKFGQYDGGLFCAGSAKSLELLWPSYNEYFMSEMSGGCYIPSLCPANANSGGWVYFDKGLNDPRLSNAALTESRFTEALLRYSAPSFAGIHPLLPLYLHAYEKSGCSVKTCILGEVPGMRITRSDVYKMGEVVRLGDTAWMILPVSTASNLHALALLYDGA